MRMKNLVEEMERNLLNLLYEVEKAIDHGEGDRAIKLLEDAYELIVEFRLKGYEETIKSLYCKAQEL